MDASQIDCTNQLSCLAIASYSAVSETPSSVVLLMFMDRVPNSNCLAGLETPWLALLKSQHTIVPEQASNLLGEGKLYSRLQLEKLQDISSRISALIGRFFWLIELQP